MEENSPEDGQKIDPMKIDLDGILKDESSLKMEQDTETEESATNQLSGEQNAGICIESVHSLSDSVLLGGQNLPTRPANNAPTHIGIQKFEPLGGPKMSLKAECSKVMEDQLKKREREQPELLRSSCESLSLVQSRPERLKLTFKETCSNVENELSYNKVGGKSSPPNDLSAMKYYPDQSQPSTSKSKCRTFQFSDDQCKTKEHDEKLVNQRKENNEKPSMKDDLNVHIFGFPRTILEVPECGYLQPSRDISYTQLSENSSSANNGIKVIEFVGQSQPTTPDTEDSSVILNSGPEMQMQLNEASDNDSVAANWCDDDDWLRDHRERWSNEAKIVVYEKFRHYIKKRKGPGLKQCRELIQLEPKLFEGRSAAQVNSLISNWILGKSAIPADEFPYDSDNDLTLYDFQEDEREMRRKYFPKRRWSREAKELVITAFADSIKNRANPGHDRCRELIRKNPSILGGRTPVQVNLLVDNWLRGKSEPPYEFRHLFPNKN